MELVEGEAIEDKELEETVDNYFLGVELWALSFAKAGITACDPLPSVAETPGSDSTDYVQVPWDVFDKWLARAHSNTRKVPLETRLQWLKNRVEADIRIWIEDYRLKTELTLGKVIKATFAQTSCSWYFDQEDVAPTRGRPRKRSRSQTS